MLALCHKFVGESSAGKAAHRSIMLVCITMRRRHYLFLLFVTLIIILIILIIIIDFLIDYVDKSIQRIRDAVTALGDVYTRYADPDEMRSITEDIGGESAGRGKKWLNE